MNQVGSHPLLDRYQIEKEIGSGGFGVTFLAKDTRMPSQRTVVIKKLKPGNTDKVDHKIIEDFFLKEASILEEIGRNHPNIPELYDYFEDGGNFYLVQEYIEGQTLADISPISQEQAFSILTSLLRTLQYIQDKGLIHRDIKPENIIIRSSDGLPVLIDFGAVKDSMGKVRRSSGSVISSVIIGTRGFMSPEQSVGRPIFSSDLYALGFTIIYALTNKLPVEFQPDPKTGDLDWKKSIPNLDPTLEKVLDKAIQDDRSNRYSTADEMYQGLHSSQPKKSIKTTEIAGNGLDYHQNIQPPTPPLPTTVIDPTPPINTSNSMSNESQKQSNFKKVSLFVLGGLTVLGVAIGSYFLTNMVTAANTEIKQKNDEIAQLQGTLTDKNNEIEQLNQQIAQLFEDNEEDEGLNDQLNKANKKIARLEGIIEAKNQQIQAILDDQEPGERYDPPPAPISERPNVTWKTSCGSPFNSSTKVWWSVKTEGSNLELVKNNYCGDALLYSGGETQVASFTSKAEAADLATTLEAHSGESFWIRESVRK